MPGAGNDGLRRCRRFAERQGQGHRRRADTAPAGFTLLEVVVALVIASLALIVLFRAGGEGLFSVDTAARAEEAAARAQSHVAALGRDAALVQGTSEGDDGGGYRWRLHVEPAARWQTQGAADATRVVTTLYRIEIVESWPGNGKDRSVVLRTRRLGTMSLGQ